MTIMGTNRRRKLIITVIMLVWQSLGLDLAFRKGQIAKDITWIGGDFFTSPTVVTARAKNSIIEEIIESLEYFKKQKSH